MSFATVSTGSSRHAPPKRCSTKHARILGRSGSAVLFMRQTGPDDGKYGAPHSLYACLRSNQAPRDLFDFEDGDTPSEAIVRFNGRYVAFYLGWASTACVFYESAGAIDCGSSLFESVNLAGGKGGVSITDEDPNTTPPPNALVLTHDGWIAWSLGGTPITSPLMGDDSHGERTLDPGSIDPRSLRVSGKNVRWTDAGVPHSAALS